MPDYKGSYATPRLDLGVALMEFIDTQIDFIGTRVCPIFKSGLKAAIYSAITRESLAMDGDTKRGPRGNYNRGTFGAKDKSFNCLEHGWEQPLSDDERALYQNDFSAELATVKTAQGVVLRAQEKRIADKLFNTSTFTGANLFTDYSSSGPWATTTTDIKAQIVAVKAKIRQNCGMLPNALILSYTNIERLKNNSNLKDAVKYTARATDQELANALADYLGLKYIIVGNAIRNTAKEGKDFAGADIWSSLYAMLAIIAQDGQDLSQPAIGRTFLWTADSPDNIFAEQYRDEEIRSDVYRVRQQTDENVIDPYFGHLLKVA